MLLTITCTANEAFPDAMVLGYLLFKHPDRLFEKKLSFGIARVFYPEATPERTTAALQVTLDPIALVRSAGKGFPTLDQYVSDRPYVPSSFLSVALSECFSTAFTGRCESQPDAVNASLPLSATLTALSCDGGEALVRRLWEPLGYTVTIEADPELLDDRFPEWGAARLYNVTVVGSVRLRDLLAHLNVLVPVLDNAKHYFISDDEVEKLLRRGEGWLADHPAKEAITARYLRYRRTLTDAALVRLAEVAEEQPETILDRETASEEGPLETRQRLNDRRIASAQEAIRSVNPPAKRVVDLGCGEGKTLSAIRQAFPSLAMLTGMDVAPAILERAARRLHLDRLEGEARDRIALLQGSLVYQDDRLRGYDVALLMEVIEHIDAERLEALEEAVFRYAHPRRVILTTPNAEYNTVWESLPAGKFRHADHRFEWSREQFQTWAQSIATRYSYTVNFSGIGDEDQEGRGTPTQMAVFDIALL